MSVAKEQEYYETYVRKLDGDNYEAIRNKEHNFDPDLYRNHTVKTETISVVTSVNIDKTNDDTECVEDSDYNSKLEIKCKQNSEMDSKSFTCIMCSYETNTKFLLSRHMKTHADDRPYKCSVCERGFKAIPSLMNHRNTHLGYKPHACSSCEMAFTTSSQLQRHMRYRHTKIRPHKCTECDYCSVEISKLRRHMRCHTGERPYQCPHCTYASPDTFNLKRHIRVHTGEKPYECDICNARFTQLNILKSHRLIHSVNENRVFQCHLCPTTRKRETDLQVHIKKLHSSDHPIPCEECGEEFPDRYSYNIHTKVHKKKINRLVKNCYRCEYCPFASLSMSHFESHVCQVNPRMNRVNSNGSDDNKNKVFPDSDEVNCKEIEEGRDSKNLNEIYDGLHASHAEEQCEEMHVIDIKQERIEAMDIAQTAAVKLFNVKVKIEDHNNGNIFE